MLKRLTTLLILLSTILAPLVALAGSPIIQISAVLASHDKKQFDPRLRDLRSDLRALPFKGYQLYGIHSCRLESGDQCGMDLPGGDYLHVMAVEQTDRYLKMRLLVNRNNRPVLVTDITLNRDANVIIKGPRSQQGAIGSRDPCATRSRGYARCRG